MRENIWKSVREKMHRDEEFRSGKLFRLIGFINKCFCQQIEAELQEKGYHDFQILNIWLLILIERFPEYAMNDLAQIVNQSRANISIVSKKLEIKGYIRKVHPENNKKIIYLIPTEKWTKLKPIVFDLIDQLDQKIINALSDKNYQSLINDLSTVAFFLRDEMEKTLGK